MASVDIGDQVIYTGAKEGTWTWPGKAKIVSFDPNRKYFEGNRVPQGQVCHGPAVLLVFNHNNLDLWVEPSELAPDLEAQ